jgi:type IV pilus assembly protein PilC
MNFAYIALDADGSEKSGLVDEADLAGAVAVLRRQGLFPTSVAPASTARTDAGRERAGSGKRPAVFSGRVRPRELGVFTRQLASLLRAGVPLLRSLEVLGRQQRSGALRSVTAAMGEAIGAGSTLAQSMGRHPRVFSGLYVNMIRAGEASGALEVVLERLAGFQEKSQRLRSKVRAALTYPLIVLAVALLILAGLLVFVVPRFQQIFADLLRGAPLPALTRAVLAVSEAVQRHFLLIAGLSVVAWFAFLWFRRTPRGARWVDTALIRLPLGGDLVLKVVVARLARTLGTLLASGVPILQAFLITRDTCGNLRVAAALSTVHDRVREGEAVTGPLAATGVFPALVVSMVEVGEQSGQLPEMFGRVADIYEEEVDVAVAGLSSLIEPVMILFLALVVGTIVIALFLPIIRIVQLLT